MLRALYESGFATLIVDHDAQEDVAAAIDWIACQAIVGDLPSGWAQRRVGCYGAGTAAAAVLVAATERPDRVAAVVAFDGRLDIDVSAPALLISGTHGRAVGPLIADWFALHLAHRQP